METAMLALNVIVNSILFVFLANVVGVPAFGMPVNPIILELDFVNLNTHSTF